MTNRSGPEPDTETVVDTYDRLASVYDRSFPMEAKTRACVLELLALGGDERAMEVGCGPGRGLAALAELTGPDGQVLGIDAAAGMVQRANRRVAE